MISVHSFPHGLTSARALAITLYGTVAALSGAAAGCASEHAPARAPAAVSSAAVIPVAPVETQESVVVSETVRRRCELPDEPADAPRFDYDEADLRPRGRSILDALAHCLREGAMQGEAVTLVGHADPRGSEAYNYALAARRAQAAADYLLSKGVPDTQLWVESRGELDATGETEAEWQLDRNVLIRDRSEAQASN